jgi:hypothetical protein
MDTNKYMRKIVDEMMGYFGFEKDDKLARKALTVWAKMLVGIGYELRRRETHLTKRVVQMTMDGEFVAFHESVKEAANKTGIDRTNISDVCHKRKKRNKKTSWIVRSAGGFKWKFAD